jgi:AcrR family transcriptional regulator
MTDLAQGRTGRPPKTSREQILDAAGLFEASDLQLTTLAERLSISVKTVYYYFPNRAALLDALTERTVQRQGVVDLSDCQEPREVLEEVGRWAYRVGRTQPGWYLQTAAPRGAGLRLLASYLDRMTELGVPDEAAMAAFSVVGNYALASGETAHRTEAQGGLTPKNVHAHVDEYADAATAERMTRLMAGTDLDSWFERGLRAVLTGIEQELLPKRRVRRQTTRGGAH